VCAGPCLLGVLVHQPQIKFLTFLHAGQLRLAKRIGVLSMGDSADDFYGVLERARQEGSAATAVFGSSSVDVGAREGTGGPADGDSGEGVEAAAGPSSPSEG
jgi:hypothetical protein